MSTALWLPTVLVGNLLESDVELALFHYGRQSKIDFILETQSIPVSSANRNAARARYGTGVYLTDLVPGTVSKAQIARRIYGAPFYIADLEAWLLINLTGWVVRLERHHVFLVPIETSLSIVGRVLAFGRTEEPPNNQAL